MNEESNKRTKTLFMGGSPPTAIFRHILSQKKAEERNHLDLVYSLQQIFHISIPDLHMIGAWDMWKTGGFSDEELNKELAGKLKLKEPPAEDYQ